MFYFFFQAEDGIRDWSVTGVQTCALPILYEDITCRVRRRHGGAEVAEAEGFIGAAFDHRTSRAGDPHLHTHVLLAHPARLAADGRWTNLDGRQMFPWAKPIGHVYEAQLRAE